LNLAKRLTDQSLVGNSGADANPLSIIKLRERLVNRLTKLQKEAKEKEDKFTQQSDLQENDERKEQLEKDIKEYRKDTLKRVRYMLEDHESIIEALQEAAIAKGTPEKVPSSRGAALGNALNVN